MADFDVELINLFQERPCLYDKQSMSYKLSNVKERAWKEIAMKMESDVLHCQSRIRGLRERYCREKRAIKSEMRSGAGASTKQVWPLLNLLSFLDDYIRPRKTYSNSEQLSETIDVTELCPDVSIEYDGIFASSYDGGGGDEIAPVFLTPSQPLPCTSTSSTSYEGVRKRKRAHVSAEDDEVIKHLRLVADTIREFKKSIEEKASGKKDMIAIGTYVQESLSVLPPDIVDRVVLDIMKIVMAGRTEARERELLL